MKKNYKNAILLSAFGFSFLGAIAQESTEKNYLRQTPSLITIDQSENVQLKNTQSIFDRYLNLSQNNSFKTLTSKTDQLNYLHQKFQQTYKGIKVEFGATVLHSKNGKVISISGESYDIKDISIIPSISKQEAFNKAIAHMGASAYLWEDEAASKELDYKKPEGELVLLPMFEQNNSEVKLAYKFDIYSIAPMGGGDLYIDAITGNALFFNNKVRHIDNFGHDGRAHKTSNTSVLETTASNTADFFETFISGTAQTRYSGNRSIETTQSGGNYTLNDASRKVYTRNANNIAPVGNSLPYIANYTEFIDNDNNWTAAEYDNSNKDNAALDAHWGAASTYDYFQNVHNRDSYDGNGAQLRNYIHVDNNFDNAFWFLNVMSYGDGSSNGNEGNGTFDALTSIDVAAHEIGHAVTEFTANLAYQRESGGMNEGFSDIWGAAVEHYAKGNGNDAAPDASIWLIGDEIDRRNGVSALRSMSDPKSRNQPDTYGGTFWRNPNCGVPTQNGNDFCGVHTNSGVLNYWFYLATAGGNGTNDVGDVYNVAGIGMEKASKIAYRTLNIYLSANSTYANARTAAIQATRDLYGAGGAEEMTITNAWYAVNVGDAYNAGGNPTVCASTINTFPYDESFENTLGAWTQGSGDDFDWAIRTNGTPSSGTGPSNAVEGSYYIYVETSDPNNPSKTTILNSPCFDLSGQTTASFTFKYHMNGTAVGSLKLEASTDGTTWNQVWSRSGSQGDSWENATIDLASYTGANVRLRYTGTSGASWSGDMAIDALNLSTSGGGTDPAPTEYCASNGNDVSDEYIQRVQLGSIDNSTGATSGGYADYTSLSTTLGATNSITITPAWTGSPFSEGYAVWIDFNRDGDFNDPEEQVLSQSPTQSTSINGSFSIPTGASTGATRMRVSMKYNGIPTTCESFSYGEVEDYSVTINANAAINNITSDSTVITDDILSIYPNPLKGTILNISLTSNTTPLTYNIVNILGQQVQTGQIKNNQIEASSLESGVYILQIKTNNQVHTKRFVKE